MSKQYTVAILGATGAVGQEMVKILEERNFPVGKLIPLASARSAGKTLLFKSWDGGRTWSVPMVVNDTWLDDRDVGLLYLGGKTILLTWFSHPVKTYLEWRDIMPAGSQSVHSIFDLQRRAEVFHLLYDAAVHQPSDF